MPARRRPLERRLSTTTADARRALEAALGRAAAEGDGGSRRAARRDRVSVHAQLADRVTHENLAPDEARRATRRSFSPTTARDCCRRRGRLAGARREECCSGRRLGWRRRASTIGASATCSRRAEPVPFLVELGVMTAEGKVRAEPLRQVPPGQPLPRACRRRRAVASGRGNAPRRRLRLRQVVPHVRAPPSADGVARPRGRDRRARPEGRRDRGLLVARPRGRLPTGLRFEQGEIASFDAGEKVDLVVSLHACDTATDEAIAQAIRWEADAILAVPCCQKEAYRQIENALLAPLLRHGLAKERLRRARDRHAPRAAARARRATAPSWSSSCALEHTAKNVLIRAVQGRAGGAEMRRAYEELRDSLGLDPALERLLSAA